MNIELLNMENLTIKGLLENQDELFYIYAENDEDEPLRICKAINSKIPDTLIGVVKIEIKKPDITGRRFDCGVSNSPYYSDRKRTYAFTGWDALNAKGVEFKMCTGDIRCVFKNKDDAEEAFDYVRENFYQKQSGSDVITVSNIYSDLQLVNYNKEETDKWGWPTLENGRCFYIRSQGVTKSKSSDTFGFTLRHPAFLKGAN